MWFLISMIPPNRFPSIKDTDILGICSNPSPWDGEVIKYESCAVSEAKWRRVGRVKSGNLYPIPSSHETIHCFNKRHE